MIYNPLLYLVRGSLCWQARLTEQRQWQFHRFTRHPRDPCNYDNQYQFSISQIAHAYSHMFPILYNYYTHKTRAQLKWSLQNGKIIINMPNHSDKVTAPNKVTKTYKEAQFIQLTPFHHGPTILGLPCIHQRGYTSKARNKTIYT